MNTSKPGPHWDEAQIDQLLTGFFQQELPEEFRESDDVTSIGEVAAQPERPAQRNGTAPPTLRISSNSASSPVGSSSNMGGLLAVVVSCLGLMLLVMLQVNGPADNETGLTSLPEVPAAPEEKAEPLPALAQDNSGVQLKISNGGDPVEKVTYDTREGKVEQRNQRVWTQLEVYDPETGSQTDVMMQELNIEIFPIEDDEPSPKK